MGRMRLRRRAREAGFDAVRAIYRERRDANGTFFVPLLVGAVVGLPAGLAAGSWWLGLLLSVVVLVPAGLWILCGPVLGPFGRRWYAVCESGVVAWSATRGYAAVSWVELAELRVQKEWEIFPENRARDLLKALRIGRPVRFARFRQAAVAAAVSAWLGTVFGVVVLPWSADLFRGEQPPRDMRDLARVCTGGEGHGRTAPYEGEAPHPAAVFTQSGFVELAMAGPGRPEPAPEEVQVVGCVRSADRSAPASASICHYLGGHSVHYFPATYQVEVYEARTGRRLGAFTLEATEPPGCAFSEIFAEGESHREQNLTPSDKQYEQGLAEFVTSPAS
jgi:hypothetical protein